MGVKAFLDKDNRGFISLKNLLERMSQHDGATLQQAAGALYRAMYGTDRTKHPQWLKHSHTHGIFPAVVPGQSDCDLDHVLIWGQLGYVAATGSWISDDDKLFGSEEYGFESEAIFRFLKDYSSDMNFDSNKIQVITSTEKEVGEKSKSSYLNIIAALLNLITEKPNGIEARFSSINTHNELIEEIHNNYGDTGGLSKSNLEKKFASAKQNLASRT